MFASERHQEIINLLKEEGKVKVKSLSEKFNVSEDCIRKDLKSIEMKGLCKRAYGGAILISNDIEPDVSRRIHKFTDEKIEIAKKAFEIIQEKETIFLDISTTNIYLAQLLANSDKQCTVVSNMIDILQILSNNTKLKIIALGGVMNHDLNGFVGAPALDLLDKYYFDRCFMGSAGIDYATLQLTAIEMDDALVKEKAIENAKMSYLMVDQRKFSMHGAVRYSHISKIDCVITNNILTADSKRKLKKYNIKYI